MMVFFTSAVITLCFLELGVPKIFLTICQFSLRGTPKKLINSHPFGELLTAVLLSGSPGWGFSPTFSLLFNTFLEL